MYVDAMEEAGCIPDMFVSVIVVSWSERSWKDFWRLAGCCGEVSR